MSQSLICLGEYRVSNESEVPIASASSANLDKSRLITTTFNRVCDRDLSLMKTANQTRIDKADVANMSNLLFVTCDKIATAKFTTDKFFHSLRYCGYPDDRPRDYSSVSPDTPDTVVSRTHGHLSSYREQLNYSSTLTNYCIG